MGNHEYKTRLTGHLAHTLFRPMISQIAPRPWESMGNENVHHVFASKFPQLSAADAKNIRRFKLLLGNLRLL